MKTLLFLLPLVSAAVRGQTAPEALDLLVRSDGPVLTAQTVRLIGSHSLDLDGGAGLQIHTKTSFSFEFHGGKTHEETKNGDATTLTVFDGSNAWAYRSFNNSYIKSAATRFPSAESGIEYLQYGRNSANITSAKIEGEEQLTFAGKPAPCDIVLATYKGLPGNPVARNVVRRVWISRDRDLVLRDNWTFENTLNNVPIKPNNLIDYTTIEWDIPLADDLFTFQPPAGSRLDPMQATQPILAGLVPGGNGPATGSGGGIGNGRGPASRGPLAPAPVLLNRTEPEYTAEARAAGLQGTVSLFLSVMQDGTPADVQIMHGLGMGLDQKAVQAVQQWRFRPGTTSAGQSADVSFHLDDGGPWRIRLAAYSVKQDNSTRATTLVKPVLSRYTAPDPAACPAGGGRAIVTALVGSNGSPREVQPQTGGDPLGEAAAKAIKSWRFQPGTADGKSREADASFELECGSPPSVVSGVSRAGGGVTNPAPIYRPEPMYSEEARKSKLQGAVLLTLVVDATGHATNIRVIKPLGLGLDEKAIEAVKAWRFKPGMKDGQPVAIQAQIEVTFRLL